MGKPRFVRHYYGGSSLFLGLREMFQLARCPPVDKTGATAERWRVAPLGNRGISAYTPLPHAYRSGVTSVVGTQRRGIHRLLILSCRSYDCRSPRRPRLILGRSNGGNTLS